MEPMATKAATKRAQTASAFPGSETQPTWMTSAATRMVMPRKTSATRWSMADVTFRLEPNESGLPPPALSCAASPHPGWTSLCRKELQESAPLLQQPSTQAGALEPPTLQSASPQPPRHKGPTPGVLPASASSPAKLAQRLSLPRCCLRSRLGMPVALGGTTSISTRPGGMAGGAGIGGGTAGASGGGTTRGASWTSRLLRTSRAGRPGASAGAG
mmetsp:Transcript_12786/g.29005  ORF Transcript_12786/g.29005 Transcript_12786/m.29005 type:complete len:215 (-) Transcript_12786:362-1006(-)